MNLPPLNALRAFECAARNGGYVAAARELGVTPAAVSQQVRRLEDHLGRRLFTRHNNKSSNIIEVLFRHSTLRLSRK